MKTEISNLHPQVLRQVLHDSYYHFARYFFRIRYGRKMQLNQHVKVICGTLQKCIDGQITNLIINIPPGFSKSMLAGEFLFPYAMARNKYAKSIILSYGQGLSYRTSQSAKNIINLPEYQRLFPQKLQRAENSKGFWRNSFGGGLMASSSGGEVTGHDAGSIASDIDAPYIFDGLLEYDDPQKPKDINSALYRKTINELYENTIKSRARNPKTPKIIIMQRLHVDDLSGFLLRGGDGEKWHHLLLPAEIKADFEYPAEYTHGIPVKHNLPVGALWEYKIPLHKLIVAREISPFVTAAQYDQMPLKIGAGIFKDKYFKYYELGSITFDYRFITADTAQKTKEHNDYSVIACWGVSDGNLYMIDLLRGKWEAPELERSFRDFWNKHNGSGTQTVGRLKYAKIEDKASGTGLIQSLQDEIDIVAIPRNTDKLTRALDCVPFMASGKFFLPDDCSFVSDFKLECRNFSGDFKHDHDDQVDAMLDAIEEITGGTDLTSGVMFRI